MLAKDVMSRSLLTVGPDTEVPEIARMLLEWRVSAAPVLDDAGRLVGIVSEGDLMRRPESGTLRRRSWWLTLLTSPTEQARGYTRSHGRRARDVMSREVVTVTPDTPLNEIANLLERRRIKRVPVLDEGRLVGIVSRANLLQGLVAQREGPAPSAADRDIQAALLAALDEAGVRTRFVNVVVAEGIAHLWGAVESPEEKDAARVAAENTAGVRRVEDNLGVLPPGTRAMLWAD